MIFCNKKLNLTSCSKQYKFIPEVNENRRTGSFSQINKFAQHHAVFGEDKSRNETGNCMSHIANDRT